MKIPRLSSTSARVAMREEEEEAVADAVGNAEAGIVDDFEEALLESLDVPLVSEGIVNRHASRGPSSPSSKALKADEDKRCNAGMRNAAIFTNDLERRWGPMRRIAHLLVDYRKGHSAFRGLVGALGPSPSREPPSLQDIFGLRLRVGRLLGVPDSVVDECHPVAPWRWRLFEALLGRLSDPDLPLVSWLRDGAPFGIYRSIQPGGWFPAAADSYNGAEGEADDVYKNHPSFWITQGIEDPPGLAWIKDQVEAGRVRLFTNRSTAEHWLGQKSWPAPLGTISKLKPDGSLKHRPVQDQRRNGVNAWVNLPERQVLPRPIDHAKDCALLGSTLAEGEDLWVLILDLVDAFLGVPLHPEEMATNCSTLEVPITRARPPLDQEEPVSGSFIIWRVLGFGGRPNPLLYARVASFLCRTGQTLLRPSRDARSGLKSCAPGRLQMFVDDPILALAGTRDTAEASVDVLLMWWLVLGAPLAWKKGVFSSTGHQWIGVRYSLSPAGDVWMQLPATFLEELLVLLKPFCADKGHIAEKDAEALACKAGRVACVIPWSVPFVGSLWGALNGARNASKGGARESPPGRVPVKRFSFAAKWLRALILGEAEAPSPLIRVVTPSDCSGQCARSDLTTIFDASPWGGGAVLVKGQRITEYIVIAWSPELAAKLNVVIGEPAGQTTWEYFTLLVVLVMWGPGHETKALAVLGDNTASLQCAVTLRSTEGLRSISREIAWRLARYRWKFSVGHVPTELNLVADALSRLQGKDPVGAIPLLREATARVHPDLMTLWKAS